MRHIEMKRAPRGEPPLVTQQRLERHVGRWPAPRIANDITDARIELDLPRLRETKHAHREKRLGQRREIEKRLGLNASAACNAAARRGRTGTRFGKLEPIALEEANRCACSREHLCIDARRQ